jgi:hypothetical protein
LVTASRVLVAVRLAGEDNTVRRINTKYKSTVGLPVESSGNNASYQLFLFAGIQIRKTLG